jgi:hypothetical protein
MGEQGWDPVMVPVALAMALIASFYWLVPLDDRVGRMASFCFLAAGVYFAVFVKHVYPWYRPPVALFGIVAVASGLVHLAGAIPLGRPVWRWAAVALLLALACERGWMLRLVAEQMKVQEAEVEMGNRKRVGEWLREHVKPGDRVYLEPVGYVGYFSGARILDWPGLVSPEVVRLRKAGWDRFDLEGQLKPEWFVLRPFEAANMADKDYFREYEEAAVFDVNERISDKAYPDLPGRSYLQFDAKFTVYRRKDVADRAASGG